MKKNIQYYFMFPTKRHVEAKKTLQIYFSRNSQKGLHSTYSLTSRREWRKKTGTQPFCPTTCLHVYRMARQALNKSVTIRQCLPKGYPVAVELHMDEHVCVCLCVWNTHTHPSTYLALESHCQEFGADDFPKHPVCA